jgi:hypothetical protein
MTKVTLEFELTDPHQKAIFIETVQRLLLQQPQQPPPAAVEPVTAASPSEPAPQSLQPEAATSATPISDLQKQLHAAYGAAYNVNAAEAMKISQNLRAQFGTDASTWTAEQLGEAVTRISALATF